MKQYIKTDRNGTKYFLIEKKCRRCGGRGGSDAWKNTDWTCWECGGSGIVFGETEIIKEYTAEYASKLEEKRMAKMAEEQARIAEEQARIEAEEKARREAEEKAEADRKAKSQYIGSIGEKIEIDVTFDHTAWFEGIYGKTFIHTFIDDQENKLIWKTSTRPYMEDGSRIRIKATIKDHSEYKDEKQTSIIRVKIIE